MNNECDNYEVIYCADDDEYTVYCEICDKLCIERKYKRHLKSGTHTNKDNDKFLQIKVFKINCFQ